MLRSISWLHIMISLHIKPIDPHTAIVPQKIFSILEFEMQIIYPLNVVAFIFYCTTSMTNIHIIYNNNNVQFINIIQFKH